MTNSINMDHSIIKFENSYFSMFVCMHNKNNEIYSIINIITLTAYHYCRRVMRDAFTTHQLYTFVM